jgi:hypothetical protein
MDYHQATDALRHIEQAIAAIPADSLLMPALAEIQARLLEHWESTKPEPTIEDCDCDFPQPMAVGAAVASMGLPLDAPAYLKTFCKAFSWKKALEAFAAEQGLEPLHGVYLTQSKPSQGKRTYPRIRAYKGKVCPNAKAVQHLGRDDELTMRRRVRLAELLEQCDRMMERDRLKAKRWILKFEARRELAAIVG